MDVWLHTVKCFIVLCVLGLSMEHVGGYRRAVPKTEEELGRPLKRGNKIKESRIVGGKVAVAHSHPSIISMKFQGYTACGGTIIKPNWILTAAHCVEDSQRGSDYVVTAGEHRRSLNEGTEQVSKVLQVIVHKKYNVETVENDIALLEISPLQLDQYVQLAHLPAKSYVPSGELLVSGWGLTRDGGSPSDLLQEVTLPVIPDAECQQKYKTSTIRDTVICTMAMGGGRDACQGDSGGPLYYINSTQHVIVGVVSWGEGCAMENKPGVFTEVSYYLDWINGKISAKKNQKGKTDKKKKTTRKPMKKAKTVKPKTSKKNKGKSVDLNDSEY